MAIPKLKTKSFPNYYNIRKYNFCSYNLLKNKLFMRIIKKTQRMNALFLLCLVLHTWREFNPYIMQCIDVFIQSLLRYIPLRRRHHRLASLLLLFEPFQLMAYLFVEFFAFGLLCLAYYVFYGEPSF